MGSGQRVAVFGAYGHTGRFVVAELRERGYVPVLSGRDAGKLRALAASHPGLEARPASVDDPGSLDRALAARRRWSTVPGPSPRRPPR
ncbi:NAD(P)H-binding protein [Actinomadura madurae]|uniref:NAD(P)H-binding protein n=1 Tax=Actinomadura madurae TaxID=1993 RepID=UPI0020D20AE9|nr:NAD(P)H-binding protein [Actinomadura madurae]MCQ0007271.1 NAD(P)H-binding protein [Actinomadura madurae]